MSNVLVEICSFKREEVASARAMMPSPDVTAADPPRSIDWGEFVVVAEVKRASPSVGRIASDVNASDQAQTYERGGAGAISVLTDEKYFGGSLADLVAVRETVDLPVLRKDFTVDHYQIDEARSVGADIVLLIVAALDRAEIVEMAEHVRELAMTPLVEVHAAGELDAALDALGWGGVLGVNARNLKTLEVDKGAWDDIAAAVPPGIKRIAESGISTAADAERARASDYDGVLCGEALMRAHDPAGFVAALRGAK